MSKGYRAQDYHITDTKVLLETKDSLMKELFDRCEALCKKNLAVFNDKTILREGSIYDGVWLETQPMGGEMYAKRSIEAALNNQLIFMEHQKKNGRLPGTIFYDDFLGVQVCYDWLGFCFPMSAFRMYFLIDHDKNYLKMLYECLKDFDEYLWEYRDSNHDGCLEIWCTWDTGEDLSNRFTHFNIPDGRCGGEEPPCGVGKLPYASMDVMSYSCQGREVLSMISDILKNGEREKWAKQAQKVRDKIRSYLWIDEKHACYDRNCENEFMDVLLHNNLRCMYFGSFSQEMADQFLKYHLFNPQEFWTPVPLPSIAANDEMFQNYNSNNWSGPAQGLTYQRAIQALELYGHMAEIRIIGKKFIKLLCEKKRLVQQYDPFDGTPCVDHTGKTAPDGYGPTILAALEYIALLGGIRISMDRIEFSAVMNLQDQTYTQQMLGHSYKLQVKDNKMSAFVDGKKVFEASSGISVITDMSGNIQCVWGIEETECSVVLCCDGVEIAGNILPNQQLKPEKKGFYEIKRVAFDYPYHGCI